MQCRDQAGRSGSGEAELNGKNHKCMPEKRVKEMKDVLERENVS